ncbi:hypothetical protein M23134_06201 [Microscilla marina ATCC 23134]|uniref:Uncharacterized protein n=1 Tax=Microscilla marina ATCC 23134 TaxID=313606 RepID=A1ZVS5_MICM2|nr:hypothetical protein M23134_06201 [Microscilla marina ATCC 23134]
MQKLSDKALQAFAHPISEFFLEKQNNKLTYIHLMRQN